MYVGNLGTIVMIVQDRVRFGGFGSIYDTKRERAKVRERLTVVTRCNALNETLVKCPEWNEVP